MQRCKAFVFAGEEDFGIVMAEAQACGKPVIAFAKGGAGEIVRQRVTGMLFDVQSVECILDTLNEFDRISFDPTSVRASALRFSRQHFMSQFFDLVKQVLAEQQRLRRTQEAQENPRL